MNRLPGVLFAITLATLPVMAQSGIDGFEPRLYKDEAGSIMPYRLFIPDGYDKHKRYPLVLWLHGAGGSGFDNLQQISGDQIPGTHIWTTRENQVKHPAFVLVPQTVRAWDSTLDGKNGNRLSPELVHVLGILDSLKTEFRIDSKRLYIAGQSIGGFGTWNFITKRPDIFAAAIILCGGGNPELAPNVRRLPIWSFQGDKDNAAFLESNRKMIAAVRKAGGNPRYTEYEGAGHDIWDRVFKEPMLVSWLFAQHK